MSSNSTDLEHADGEDVSWMDRFKHWMTSFVGTGYGISLVFHLVLVLIASLIIFEEFANRPFSTLLSASDQVGIVIDDALDTRLQVEQPAEKPESHPELQAVESIRPKGMQPRQPRDLSTAASSAMGEGTDGSEDDSGDSGVDFQFAMPKAGNVVTKGSFSAWTIPEKPIVGRVYRIVVQIRLPKRVKRYRASDLSGMVIGTDNYTQELPYDLSKPGLTQTINHKGRLIPVRPGERLQIIKNQVQLIIRVPGANERLIEDTINIRSRILREEQKLEIVF